MHIAIIPDGNRRWAKQNNLPTVKGHYEGSLNFERVVDLLPEFGIDILTIWALSTDNMTQRAQEEVSALWKLLRDFAKDKKRHAKMINHGIKITLIGNIKAIPEEVQRDLMILVNATKDCSKYILQIAINYGGQDEILRAVKDIVSSGLEITKENFENCLDTLYAPDLIIRTGGHQRLSGFLLWHSGYSELYFTNVFWPDFDKTELAKAIEFFNTQQRNFGK